MSERPDGSGWDGRASRVLLSVVLGQVGCGIVAVILVTYGVDPPMLGILAVVVALLAAIAVS